MGVAALATLGRATALRGQANRATSRPTLAIVSDDVGAQLKESFIWADARLDRPGIALGFRRAFDLDQAPRVASFSVFADARYVLWVNGTYVDRGPSRFQPNGPQYDVVDVAARLRKGHNVLALLVVGNLSGGKVMRHQPGLAGRLDVDDRQVLATDPTWTWSDQTGYREVKATWADITDGTVDGGEPDGDWTTADYVATRVAWRPAGRVDGGGWGPLTRTLVPPLRETPVPFTIAGRQRTLPVTLSTGERLELDTGRIVQAYPVLQFDAEPGTEVSIEPWDTRYLARGGRQSFFTLDSRGLSHARIEVRSGRMTVTGVALVERLYPFERVGSFDCDDDRLNRLWLLCARSCELLSEDSYVDCADRERVEWMDNTPPAYAVTRTVMAARGPDGATRYGDPRLLAQLIRRTALTLQPDGWVKAHTCSDRFDIHAKMEDRACDWVAGEREYLDATDDPSILRQTWPAIVAQMEYFLARRSPRGLVRGRDWVVWGNPTAYLVGETTTLNAFVYRALVDASSLARSAGDRASGDRYAGAAVDLARSVNSTLWDDRAACYSAGWFDDADVAENLARKHRLPFPLADHRAPPTFHATLFALDRGIVPAGRRPLATAAMLRMRREYGDGVPLMGNFVPIMADYYATAQAYALDRPDLDRETLDLFRRRWAPMVAAPWQCSWEGFAGGSKAHVYGMYPGYFLSAYVLGVRRDDPVAARSIVVEPHLGDLRRASGAVVTEFGPCQVGWERHESAIDFQCDVPPRVRATLRLPVGSDQGSLILDGRRVASTVRAGRTVVDLGPGPHTGRASFAATRPALSPGSQPYGPGAGVDPAWQ